jgi:pyruvate-formate lyase
MILIRAEAAIPGVALGRFDQYTWPFLKQDLEAGRLTPDQAQDITDAFFLKSNCRPHCIGRKATFCSTLIYTVHTSNLE